MARMTSFNPGQRPPQVTIPIRQSSGLKKRFFRGPAFSSEGAELEGKLPEPIVASTRIRTFSSTKKVEFKGDLNFVGPRVLIVQSFKFILKKRV